MVVPKPSNRKVNCSISTKAMPRRRCSVLIKTDVTFWKTKLHVKNNRHLKYFVGHQTKSDPSITIRSENDKSLSWTDPMASHDPATSPATSPAIKTPTPPERSNKVWRRRKTSPFMTNSFKSTCKERRRNADWSQFRQRNWFCYFERTRLQDKSHIPSQRDPILSLRPRCERVYHPFGQSDHQNPRADRTLWAVPTATTTAPTATAPIERWR